MGPTVEELPLGESNPIHDTMFRHYLTVAAVKCLWRFRPHTGPVLFLSRKLCVKVGSFQHLSEAATMQFIAKHTSIPVPKVYCAFKRKGWTYIVMERIDGRMVSLDWASRTEESKAKILAQLKDMVDEMRRLSPPTNARVANVDGGSLYDSRLPGKLGDWGRFGPFNIVQDFHRYLRRNVDAHPNLPAEVNDLIAHHERVSPLPCFTHGDLSSFNILVRGDNVVGIIDWETAGWYPSYWEYTTALNKNPYNRFWQKEMAEVLEPRPKDLAMEEVRDRYFGDIWPT